MAGEEARAAPNDPTPDARVVLLTLYRENSRQARHYESERGRLAVGVGVAAAIVVGAGAGHGFAAGALLVLLGAFGFGVSLTHHERMRLHVERVHAVRRELSRRFPVDVGALYGEAATTHARRFPRLPDRTARVHWLWLGLHAAIGGLGIVLGLRALGS